MIYNPSSPLNSKERLYYLTLLFKSIHYKDLSINDKINIKSEFFELNYKYS